MTIRKLLYFGQRPNLTTFSTIAFHHKRTVRVTEVISISLDCTSGKINQDLLSKCANFYEPQIHDQRRSRSSISPYCIFDFYGISIYQHLRMRFFFQKTLTLLSSSHIKFENTTNFQKHDHKTRERTFTRVKSKQKQNLIHISKPSLTLSLIPSPSSQRPKV